MARIYGAETQTSTEVNHAEKGYKWPHFLFIHAPADASTLHFLCPVKFFISILCLLPVCVYWDTYLGILFLYPPETAAIFYKVSNRLLEQEFK